VGWAVLPAFAVAVTCSDLEPDVRAGLLVLLGCSLGLLLPIPPVWPLVQLSYLLPLGIGFVVHRGLRPTRHMLARGRLELLPVVLLGGVSIVTLWVWARWFARDLTAASTVLPDLPLPLLVVAFFVFSIVNAVLEEVAFRGFLQGSLQAAWGTNACSLLLPAVLFGACHLHGIPGGPVGALMAGSWGLFLGWVRNQTGGLLTPVLAHIAADAAIFSLVLGATGT